RAALLPPLGAGRGVGARLLAGGATERFALALRCRAPVSLSLARCTRPTTPPTTPPSGSVVAGAARLWVTWDLGDLPVVTATTPDQSGPTESPGGVSQPRILTRSAPTSRRQTTRPGSVLSACRSRRCQALGARIGADAAARAQGGAGVALLGLPRVARFTRLG